MEADTDVTVIAAQSDELLGDTMAEPGETIYVTCESTAALAEHMEISLWQDAAGKAPQTTRTRWALLILLAVIISASFGLVPVEIAAFTGALLMVITRCSHPAQRLGRWTSTRWPSWRDRWDWAPWSCRAG